jgi:exopolyphosphatase / guanosine-5'-triphosphate,3'-diphosphate pyrophosphatase
LDFNKTVIMQNGTRLAAVDLGSNSFRLEIGQLDHGQINRAEYYKEIVRQGNGLDSERNLTPEALQRGWDCLARFGERLAGFSATQVRAVATQTLREARNRDVFLAKGQALLGFSIDVIPGHEEARLIYQGVTQLLPQSDERRLVVDIGGRSTEMILGQGFDASVMASYRVGSVAWSMRYFPEGQFTASAFQGAEIAASAILDEAANAYRPDQWDVAYGSSGTVGAVVDALTAAGGAPDVITREGLDWLRDRLIKAQSVDRLRLDGVKDDRRAVIGGGLSILRSVFDLLNISTMQAAQGALRHGVLYDLLDREMEHSDLRSRTVKRLAAKFNADAVQADRVEAVAVHLLGQLPARNIGAERVRKKLGWAAQLHEVGCLISHTEYHKHGAYILANADAPGFATPELQRLSLLVLGHRGKLRKLDADFEDEGFIRQLLCLRLGALLCHARRDPDLGGLDIRQQDKQFTLQMSAQWASQFPQSVHLLREEVGAWQKTAWLLDLAID